VTVLLGQGIGTAREELGTRTLDIKALGFGRPNQYEPTIVKNSLVCLMI
jgi:hypothetical protein